jgi:predicted nuclease of predicted toxin-antitoxin system
VHIEPSISRAAGSIPGCQTRTAQQLQLGRALDAGYLKETAIRLKAVILTRDKDFVDTTKFQPGEPPGVIRLDMPGMPPTEVIPRLTIFLSSEHRRRCKKAIVLLGPRVAEIHEKRGKRVVVDLVEYCAGNVEDRPAD